MEHGYFHNVSPVQVWSMCIPSKGIQRRSVPCNNSKYADNHAVLSIYIFLLTYISRNLDSIKVLFCIVIVRIIFISLFLRAI
jgi:hypothetical protein